MAVTETMALLSRPNRIVFIGLGGIGSWLVEPVLRYFQPVCATALFVDGDFIEAKNLARQSFAQSELRGTKADCLVWRMRAMFPDHKLNPFSAYVIAANVEHFVKEGDVVFLSPDNHAVRRVVSDEAQKRKNIVVFTSGNELYDGSCHVYIKTRGVELSKSFMARHPAEVDPPGPRQGCAELIDMGAMQLIAVNFMLAAMTVMAMQLVYSYGVYRTKDEFWSEIPQEVYGDIRRLKVGTIMAGKPAKAERARMEKEAVCSP